MIFLSESAKIVRRIPYLFIFRRIVEDTANKIDGIKKNHVYNQ